MILCNNHEKIQDLATAVVDAARELFATRKVRQV
jgi:hypothetical protein